MSRKQRQAMIDREHNQLSLVRQCSLLRVSRASLYCQPTPPRTQDLELMALMDRQYPSATLRAGSEDPLLRFQEDEGLAARTGALGRSREGQAVDAVNGPGSHLPSPQHQ